MYPFRDDNVYVRNCWYVAALGSEVTREPFERTICDDPIAFYRTLAGEPVAMYGLCPHRYYPLALGRLVGDAIECGYHGFTFDGSGKCVRVPAQQDKGTGFTQRTFPVAEHGPWIWIWPGDPALADRALLPDLSLIGYHADGTQIDGWASHAERNKPFAARSQLLIDNLMDLTHFAFLHASLMESKDLVSVPARIAPFARDGFEVVRHIKDAKWDGYCEYVFGSEHRYDTADYLNRTAFFSPALIMTWAYEFTSVNGSIDIPHGLGLIRYGHAITPETRHSGHYFNANGHNVRTNDTDFRSAHNQITSDLVDQDVAAVNAMEPRIDRGALIQRELLVRSDAAAVRIRDHIQMLIDRENAPPAATRQFA